MDESNNNQMNDNEWDVYWS